MEKLTEKELRVFQADLFPLPHPTGHRPRALRIPAMREPVSGKHREKMGKGLGK